MRCAIYTRKSSDEGLEQSFNSLDAQREACEAYVRSQQHEGWSALAERYDDGGYSGGNMDRPGLQKLLADVRAGRVDVVVIYKIDRLTRSLFDFSRIADEFEKANVSFVSITQAFNTTTSMGRLMLNVLLSFAQFEREITAERIRDKVAASKAKGMWMGGAIPFGYRRVDKMLVPHEAEAPVVRELYKRFLEIGDLQLLVHDCRRRGVRKRYRGRDPKVTKGPLFERADLYKLLTSVTYAGKILHKDTVHQGLHEALIEEATFVEAQRLMAALHVEWKKKRPRPPPVLLLDLLQTPAGEPFLVEGTRHKPGGPRFYRFPDTPPGVVRRTSEQSTNRAVIETLCRFLVSLRYAREAQVESIPARARSDLDRFIAVLRSGELGDVKAALHEVVQAVYMDRKSLTIRLRAAGSRGLLKADADVTVNLRLKGAAGHLSITTEAGPQEPDPSMVRLVGYATRWLSEVVSGAVPGLNAIARRESLSIQRVSNVVELAFLAPDIKQAIMEGRHPVSLNATLLERACPLPMSWAQQRRKLGFS